MAIYGSTDNLERIEKTEAEIPAKNHIMSPVLRKRNKKNTPNMPNQAAKESPFVVIDILPRAGSVAISALTRIARVKPPRSCDKYYCTGHHRK